MRHESRRVDHQPQQHEVGVDLARKHGIEVEVEERLARQRLAVAQHAQAQAVRYDRPQVSVAAVEELLHQTVRIGCRSAALPSGTAIERQAAADEMNRHRTEEAADGKGTAVEFGAGGHRQEAEPQFPQQRQAPLVVGETGARRADGQIRGDFAELGPVLLEEVPRLGDGFVQALANPQAVVLRRAAGEPRTRIEQPPQQIQRQQATLRADGLEVLVASRHVSPAWARARRRRGHPRGAPVPRRCGLPPASRCGPADGPRIARRPVLSRRSPSSPGTSTTKAATR